MKPRFKRPLNDQHDKLIFILAFSAGIIGILGIRIFGDIFYASALNFVDVVAILYAITIIVLYVLYIYLSTDRSSISVDRASDNIYYIGLLFTLTSLAYSLIKLSAYSPATAGPGATSDQIISLLPDFGLALFSTIAGIFGRILLQQMRADPLDIETEAREELGRSVRELRLTIGEIVAQLNGLSAQTRLSLTELGQNVSQTLSDTAQKSGEAYDALSAGILRVNEKLENHALSIGEQAKNTSAMMEQMLTAANTSLIAIGDLPVSLAEKFDTAAIRINEISTNISETAEAQKSLALSVSNISGDLRKMFSENSWDDFSERINSTKEQLSLLTEELTQLSEKISQSVSLYDSQIKNLSQAGSHFNGAEKLVNDTSSLLTAASNN